MLGHFLRTVGAELHEASLDVLTLDGVVFGAACKYRFTEVFDRTSSAWSIYSGYSDRSRTLRPDLHVGTSASPDTGPRPQEPVSITR